MSPSVDLLRLKRFGHYEILDRLGSGGMGEVYRARDESLGRPLAIKVLREPLAMDPDRLARFEQEARAASALNHPSIVTIYEIGRVEGTPYIAMELVEGKTLREFLLSGPLVTRRALQLAAQAADGLAQAHAVGIVHRDLKPENVMVLDDGRLKILDFGLAKLVPAVSEDAVTGSLHSPGTQPGLILGTVGYMSPEQALARPIDFRSDQFACGSILYEMVTGKPAFRRASAVQTLAAIIEDEPEPIGDLNPSVPAPLRWIIERCLAKDPQKRYASTRDLARDLDNVLQHLAEVTSGSIGVAHVSAALRVATGALRARSGRPRRLAFGAVVAAGLLAWALRSHGPAAPSPAPPSAPVSRPSVAVLGFKNLAGRPEAAWLSTALAEMLTTELAAGGRLRTISGENVGRMKIELSLNEAESLAADTLAKVGKNLGTDMILLGTYLRQPGGQIRLDLRLQDVAKGETVVAMAETGTEAQLVDLVTQAGSHLRHSIGVAEPPAAEAGALKAGVPANLEAQRLYAEGLARLRVLDALAAKDLLLKAVAADPDFPMAHAALAEAWTRLGYDAHAKEEAKRAFDLSGNLTREERLSAEARYRETAGEWDKAVEIHRALVAFFPDNLEYGLRLAAAQGSAGRGPDALATLEAVRRLPAPAAGDPRIDLTEAEVAQALGDSRRALAAAARAAVQGAALGARLLAARARLLEAYALGRLGDAPKAAAAAEDARRIFAEAGDRGGVGWALNRVGSVLFQQGRLVEANTKYEESLTILREIGYERRVAAVVSNIGVVLWQQGDLAEAKKRYEQSQALDREIGDKRGILFSLINISNVQYEQGDVATAMKSAQQALDLSREVGDQAGAAMALRSLANALFAAGDLPRARTSDEEALRALRATANRAYAAFALYDLGQLLAAEGDLGAARRSHEEALAIRNELGDKLGRGESQTALAALALEEGSPEKAVALAEGVAEVFETEKAVDKAASAHAVRARALLAAGQLAPASAAIERAVALAANSQNPHVRLAVAVAAGRVRGAKGAAAPALGGLETALAEAARLGLVGLQLEIRLALAEAELGSGRLDRGRAHLAAVEKDARARGFGLVARKAAPTLLAHSPS